MYKYWRHPFLVSMLALALYALTIPRFITLEDAGLFQLVCHLGGIAHPPGYPLFTLMCGKLIFFSGVFGGNFISALFACAAIGVFFEIVRLISKDLHLAYLAALSYAVSSTFWSQAIIIEVYSLAVFLFALAWLFTLKFVERGDKRYWYLLCFIVGLALSNHWPLMVLSSLGLCAILFTRKNELLALVAQASFWLISIFCFSLGLSPYLSLLLNADPVIALYGSIDSLDAFFRYVTRSSYSDDHVFASYVDKLKYFAWLARESLQQFGLLSAPLIVIGLTRAFKVHSKLELLSQILIFISTSFLLLSLINFEYIAFYQAIIKPYPIIAFAVLSYWFALGVRFIGLYLSELSLGGGNLNAPIEKEPRFKQVSFIVSLGVLLAVLSSNYVKLDRHDSRFVDSYARLVLETLPENAILFTHGDNQTGPIGYLHYVEGVRPDIELRDWASLVFKNRLSAASEKNSQKMALATDYINATSRPVFSISQRLSPASNFGLYNRYNPGGEIDYIFDPKIAIYLDYLLALYLEELIVDGHEQVFLFTRLLDFARQYNGYAESLGSDALPQDIQQSLRLLRTTFPGKLAALEAFLDNLPQDGRNGNIDLPGSALDPILKPIPKIDLQLSARRALMLNLASQGELQIPFSASLQSRAVFYALYARLHLLKPISEAAAIEYYQKSIDVYPIEENTSICALLKLYEESEIDTKSDNARLRNRFPTLKCLS